MYRFEYRPQFLRDIKRLKHKHYDMQKLYTVIDDLEKYDIELLKRHYHDHALQGNLKGYRELHIDADWLLIYSIDKDRLCLILTRTGNHNTVL